MYILNNTCWRMGWNPPKFYGCSKTFLWVLWNHFYLKTKTSVNEVVLILMYNHNILSIFLFFLVPQEATTVFQVWNPWLGFVCTWANCCRWNGDWICWSGHPAVHGRHQGETLWSHWHWELISVSSGPWCHHRCHQVWQSSSFHQSLL